MDPDELMREMAEELGHSPALFSQLMGGMSLSPREAEALEAKLSAQPHDLDARAQLLGYYSLQVLQPETGTSKVLPHALWLIDNAPASELAGSPYAQVADGDLLAARWRAAADRHPDDARVQGNAARFFACSEQPDSALQFWERARALDPTLPEEPPGPLPDLEPLVAPDLTTPPRQDRPEFRFYALTEEVEEAYRTDAAPVLREKAEALLTTAESFRDNWNYGNALFHANTALGLIALAENDLPRAVQALLLSASTPGSPQLNSFGPNLRLAHRLLERGERAAVLTFLDRCAVWWSMGRGRIEQWRQQIHGGEIPAFFLNLR